MKTKGNGWTKKPELRRISSQPRYGRFDTALHFIRFAAVLAGKLIYYSRFLRKNQAEILNFRRKYRAVRARRENAALPCASGRKAPGIMRSSFLPGSGRDADVQGGGGRTSLMTGAACVSKERVPASLRIRPKSPRNHAQFIPSRFGARCGRAGRRSHVSYDGRSVRFQRARARFPAHPAEKSPESCTAHFFPVRGAMRTCRAAAVARLL